MDELLSNLINNRNFTELENRWIELVEEGKFQLKDFFEIAQELKSAQETSRAQMLLEILAEHLITQGKIPDAIEVYKNIAHFTNDDRRIREELMRLYKTLYQNSPRIDEFIKLSGIEEGEHLFRSLEKLEQFIKYDVGKVFYFEKLGIGEVIEIRPEKREIVLNFERQKGYLLKFDIARGLLTPIPPGHFLYKKYRAIQDLKKMAQEEPLELVKFLLKSFNAGLSSSDIKLHLKGIIDESEVDKFWEKTRKKLEQDANIEISGEVRKLYRFISGRIDKNAQAIRNFEEADPEKKYQLAEEYYKKKQLEIFEKILPSLIELGNENYETLPYLALDILYLCKSFNKNIELRYEIEDLLKYSTIEEIALKLKNDEHKKEFLKFIVEKQPTQWLKILKDIFFKAGDFKLFEEIEKYLGQHPEELRLIYQTVFFMPEKFPLHFQWMLKKITRGELSEFITPALLLKLIKSLEYIKGMRQLFLKVLTLERFDEIMKTATAHDAQQIRDALMTSSVLLDYEKNDFLRILNFYFPDLEKEGKTIYATESAVKKKKQELEYLLSVEIPENKKEISRAREYGDLSENFEYKAAKERQDQLYQRVREIEQALSRVKIIDQMNVDTNRVSIGTTVSLKNLKTGEIISYTILGIWDTDLDKNIISNESPLAKEILIGKMIQEVVEINEEPYQIIGISRFSP
uniref:Transcription elongation factor GreA n=1 Tax=candidate division WOR-3 bacterium TaxID=2052148 RepID=A0A7C4XLR9_UNCW3